MKAKAKDNTTITVRVRFFTNDIPSKGKFTPKVIWCGGRVELEANGLHGIHPGNTQSFRNLSQIQPAIEKALTEHRIRVLTDLKYSRNN